MSEMFAFHATMMSNTLGTSILVFTRSGFMAMLLSHYRPVGTIFAFTNQYALSQHLVLVYAPGYMMCCDLRCNVPLIGFHCRLRVQQRLALYHGIQAMYMDFSLNAEDTFSGALDLLQVKLATVLVFSV